MNKEIKLTICSDIILEPFFSTYVRTYFFNKNNNIKIKITNIKPELFMSM